MISEECLMELLDTTHKGAFDFYHENEDEMEALLARWEDILRDHGYD